MLDDGVKAAGVEEEDVRVADISIHLLEAIEVGEAKMQHMDAPLAIDTPGAEAFTVEEDTGKLTYD
jgi:hypothetical protein